MPRDSDSLILQLYARTPAPCRDYIGLTITKTEVVLNIWNITYGPHVYPKRQKRSLEEFSQDKYFQEEVKRLLGEHVLEYVTSVAKNERKLQHLLEKTFLHILKYLAMKDVISLSQTSKIMFELCNTENVWKIIYGTYCKRSLTRQDLIMAESFGWKNVLRQKIQNTNNKNLYVVPAKSNTTLKNVQNKFKCEANPKNTTPATNLNNKRMSQTNGNQSNFNQKNAPKFIKVIEENRSAKAKIDSVKSSSVLKNPKHAVSSNLKVSQTKSVANVNSCAKSPSQTSKNKSNITSVKSNKTAEIKIDIPKALEESVACNNMFKNLKSKNTQKNLYSVKNQTMLRK